MNASTNTPTRSWVKSQAVLDFIGQYRDEHNMSPSFRDIREACQLSSISVVAYHVNNLERLGYLVHHRGLARAIIITPKGQSARSQTDD